MTVNLLVCPQCQVVLENCSVCGEKFFSNDIIVHTEDKKHAHYSCPKGSRRYTSGVYIIEANAFQHSVQPVPDLDGKLQCTKCDAWVQGHCNEGINEKCPWSNGLPKPDILEELRKNAEET